MQGVTLLAGLALLGSLAVPAGLLASEQAPDPVAGEVAPVGPDEAAEEVPATQPAPEVEATVAATRTVAMQDNFFKPKRITIDPGDTVRWENRGEADHNALTKNRELAPTIGPGESSEHTFNNAGKVDYFCSLHQGMTGTIQVGASSSGGGGSGGGGSGGTTGSGGTGGIGSGSSSGSTSSGGGSFGSGSSSGGSSSLASTGSELLWLGLTGYGLLALGAFIGLGAISRRA
jgi:plastocyanin